jgi:hypothetical protein
MKVTTIGIDLAKDVFGLHGVDGQGRVALWHLRSDWFAVACWSS